MAPRRGRKRKTGRRYPSGALVPDKSPDDRVRVGRQPHRRGLAPDDRTSELGESVLGRLLLTGRLADEGPAETAAQRDEQARIRYDAGSLWAAVVGAWRAVIEAPRATAGSGIGFHCAEEDFRSDGVTCRADPDRCACLRRQARYQAAFKALAGGAPAGQRITKAVNRIAVHGDEPREPTDLVLLRLGLDRLAVHFGLAGRSAGAGRSRAVVAS